MFVKAINGKIASYPYSLGQLRRDNPHTSFPKNVPDELLSAYGVYRVFFADAPECDERTQKITQNAEPHEYQGKWTVDWVVADKTTDEVAAYDDSVKKEVRGRRGQLLAACDWVVVFHTEKGTNIPFEWELYRQQLRDITAQEGFPHSVVWPSPPA